MKQALNMLDSEPIEHVNLEIEQGNFNTFGDNSKNLFT